MEGKKAIGGKELRMHEENLRLTKNQMCKAKCYECSGGFTDGRLDCMIPACPLYPQMPYRDKVKYPPFKSLRTYTNRLGRFKPKASSQVA